MKDMKIDSNREKNVKENSEWNETKNEKLNKPYNFFFSLSLTSKMEHEDSISETEAMVEGLSHSIKENDKL